MSDTPPPLRPGEIDLDRRLVVAGMVVLALIVGAVVSFGSRPTSAPVVPTPSAIVTLTPAPDTVSAVGPTSEPCPSGWRGFVNPVHDYELCRPASWRIIQDGEPRGQLLRSLLGDLRLVDARALPWNSGAEPLEVVASNASIDLRILVNPAPSVLRGNCPPVQRAGTYASCTERVDASGRVRSDGPLRVVVASFAPAFEGDRGLFIIATMKAGAPPSEARLIERILDTVRRLPGTALL